MSLKDSILKGEIKWDDLNPVLKDLIVDSGFNRPTLYNKFVAPVVTNLAERSNDAKDQEVYSRSEIEEILSNSPRKTVRPQASLIKKDTDVRVPVHETTDYGPQDGAEPGDISVRDQSHYDTPDGIEFDTDVGTPKREAENRIGNVDAERKPPERTPDIGHERNSRLQKIVDFIKRNRKGIMIGAGAIGASAGIAALVAALVSRRKKKKNNGKVISKKASVWNDWIVSPMEKGWGNLVVGPAARAIVDEVDLADKSFTARTKKDYKSVNDSARDILGKRMSQLSDSYDIDKGTLGNFAMSFSQPFFRPGDKVQAYPSSYSSNSHGLRAVHAHGRNADQTKIHGIQPDPRLIPLTLLASEMLEGGYNRKYSDNPSIGNLAYNVPFITGQYAIDTGMSDDDIERAKTNRLDNVFMDAVKHQSYKYPAFRNLLSAYVNGGAGDVSDKKGFGISRPFLDYGASAPTQEGTNMLKKVVRDIGAAGGYGGREPDRLKDSNGRSVENLVDPYTGYDKGKADTHYNELLRFFDTVGPSIFSPKTVLGRDALLHDQGGLLTDVQKAFGNYVQYIKKDPNILKEINMAVAGGALGDTIGKLVDKANNSSSE